MSLTRNFETMSYKVADNGVAIVTIDVKDRPLNVLTPELHQDVGRIAELLRSDDSALGAVIQSGKASFMAGGDLKRIVGLYELHRSPEQAYLQSRTFTESLRKLETCGKPVAVAINGAALGGGLELALACHYRVLVDNPKASLGLPETTLGLLPGAGGTQRLPRLIGIRQAATLILSGKHIDPATALELGIVDEVVATEQLFDAAERWVLEAGDPVQAWDKRGFQIPGGAGLTNPKIGRLFQELTRNVSVESRHNYPAPIAALRCLFKGSAVSSIDTALKIETREFSALTRDPVARNMIRTMFLNRGIANRLGQRSGDMNNNRIGHVALLGCPQRCAGLAYACANAGVEVSVPETSEPEARRYAETQLEPRLAAGKSSPDRADELLSRIQAINSSTKFELIIAMAETQDKELSELCSAAPATAIVAIDSPEPSLADAAMQSVAGQQLLGFHLGPLTGRAEIAEIVPGTNTEQAALSLVMQFSRQLGITPSLQKRNPVYFSRGCTLAYIEAGIQLLGEGISPVLIENAADHAGMPTGPLALADAWSLTDLQANFSDARPGALQVLQEMIESQGRCGRSAGQGFYNYGDGAAERLWPGLKRCFPPRPHQLDVETLKQGLLSIQALCAAKYWEDELIDPVDADMISVFAWGFPSYTGGTMSYIDTLGVAGFIEQCDSLARQFGEQFAASSWLREQAGVTDRVYTDAG